MRIAHVANFYSPTSGGLKTAMHALGVGYQERGHDFLMVVPGKEHVDEVIPEGRRISIRSPKLIFTGGYRFITRPTRVKKALEEYRPDVVEVSDRTTLTRIGAWARTRGIPAVFIAHERAEGIARANLPEWLARMLPLTRMANRHNRRIAKRFSIIVATTSYAAEEFERIGVRTTLVPLGVNLDHYRPGAASHQVRSQYCSTGSLVVMASRLSPEKRPDLAIDAMTILKRRGVAAHLVSAGTGKWNKKMRRRSAHAPVTMLGHIANKDHYAALLASADVLVAPGPIETFGLAALEGLASGTPAVVNANSALPEVVGGAGIPADSTAEEFANAIQAVLRWPAEERRLKARRRAEQFPWSVTVDTMLGLHDKVPVG